LGIQNQVLTATKLKKVPLFLVAQTELLKSLSKSHCILMKLKG